MAEPAVPRPPLQPTEIISDVQKFARATNRILFGARQNSLGESIAADIYDEVIGLIPFVGDIAANGSRATLAQANGDHAAAAAHGVDFAIGLVPVIGDIADAFFPANTLLYAREMQKCHAGGKPVRQCLYKEDSLESTILSRMRR